MNKPRFRLPRLDLKNADANTRTQWAFISQSAFAYYISITASGAFLTLLIKQLGASDSLTGILSSFTIFACSFQVFSASFMRRRRSVRGTVLLMQTLQQLVVAALFLLPFIPLPGGVRVAIFAVLYLLAQISLNLVTPSKYGWMMSFVRPNNRGTFTAHNEMVSLLTGIAYNFGMSRLVDRFAAAGRTDISLALCAVAIAVCMGFHVFSLVKARDSAEVLQQVRQNPPLLASLRTSLSDPVFLKLLGAAVLFNIFSHMVVPYLSVYMLQELGLTVTFITLGSILSCGFRFVLSPAVGRMADKKGFDYSVAVGMVMAALAYGMLLFWMPANGAVLYLIYQLPLAIINSTTASGFNNLLYQYTPPKDRVSALGLYAAIAGFAGFLGSLVGGAILAAVQAAGNQVLGLPLYGQQLLAGISAVGFAVTLVYIRTVISKLKRVE